MTDHGFGWLPDPLDSRDRTGIRLGIGIDDDTDFVYPTSLRRFAGPVRNQGSSEACVGHAVADGRDTTWRAKGLDVSEPTSALAVYGFARAQHSNPNGRTLPDIGTYIRSAIRGITKHGCPPESAWPWDYARIEERPPLSVVRSGYDSHGPAGYYRLLGRSTAQVNRALALSHAVVFGVSLDEAFLSDDGPNYIGPYSGPRAGAHSLLIVGNDMHDGQRWYEVKNSWGPAWRNGGYAFLHESWLKRGFDFWVMAP